MSCYTLYNTRYNYIFHAQLSDSNCIHNAEHQNTLSICRFFYCCTWNCLYKKTSLFFFPLFYVITISLTSMNLAILDLTHTHTNTHTRIYIILCSTFNCFIYQWIDLNNFCFRLTTTVWQFTMYQCDSNVLFQFIW